MTSRTPRDVETFHATDAAAWRAWLENHHESAEPVLLIIYHQSSTTPSIGYVESIEHALCFGWIDSKAMKRDEESFYLTYTRRKPTSTWSKVNRERANRMIDQGLMTPAGYAAIDLAKEMGTWDALSDAQDGIVPGDLAEAFSTNPIAGANFEAFALSSQRQILAWIISAKKPETRQKRIATTVEMAARNERANHPKPKNARS